MTRTSHDHVEISAFHRRQLHTRGCDDVAVEAARRLDHARVLTDSPSCPDCPSATSSEPIGSKAPSNARHSVTDAGSYASSRRNADKVAAGTNTSRRASEAPRSTI